MFPRNIHAKCVVRVLPFTQMSVKDAKKKKKTKQKTVDLSFILRDNLAWKSLHYF